ncbi:hypothetical protein M0813_28436 [Anaeramoeba flamelloides]|uniref:Uncharacterized protein n=1 Tax=Anaeramoeba flamelloides TaxID=1746091 RepID=A0ABQ8XWU6_9EUKA|nr:hypothetical protein M0813_28436 [Anaeramoeba flamelloides]
MCLAWAILLQIKLFKIFESDTWWKDLPKKKPKEQNQPNKKKKTQFLCQNCTELWRKWNHSDNPTIRTMDEWIKLLLDQTEHSPEEKSDSDSDYMDESDNDETKTTNLCHQPSYNAEEMHIHLMTEKEKSTHIKRKTF